MSHLIASSFVGSWARPVHIPVEENFDKLLEKLYASHVAEIQDLRHQMDLLRAERRSGGGSASLNASTPADGYDLNESVEDEDAIEEGDANFAGEDIDYSAIGASQSTAKHWKLGKKRAHSKKSARRSNSLQWEGKVRPYLQKIVEHPVTDLCMSVLILCNALVFAFEAQYRGLKLSEALGFSDEPMNDLWPGAVDVFYALEMTFGIIFTVEVSFRFFAHGVSFFWEAWNVLDFFVISVWLLEKLVTNLPVNSQILRLGRIFRLLRLLRLVRKIQEFDALFLMTTAIRSSVSVLGWTMALLLICQLLLALVVQQTLFGFFFDPEAADQEVQLRVYEYFGSFSRSLLSLFELTFANFAPICRLLVEDVSEWWLVGCLIHKLTMGFAVIGVINAVLMQETFKVAYLDDTVMVREKVKAMRHHVAKMSELFHGADTSRDGKLDLEEFERIMTNQEIKMWLAAMELDVSNVEELFKMLNTNGDGRLSATELVQGVSQLSGTSKAQDVRKILKTVEGMEKQLKSLTTSTHPLRRLPTDRLDRMQSTMTGFSDADADEEGVVRFMF
ncbi:SCN4A [Symbiodinium sp. CCMP2592]|nr:SCN4A [Symbiodinium sp. CCMP2592]